MSQQEGILWPVNYDPAKMPIHVKNKVSILAAQEVVWAWLIRAQLWPTWYPNSANIQFLAGQPPDLALGTCFRWKTFGVTIVSTVKEFVPNERLAWDAHGTGLDAYHAWLIQKTSLGCQVDTEETQQGGLARLSRALRPNQMERMHQIWLEHLRERAISGSPPVP